VDEPLTILVAARDEEEVIAKTVKTLRRAFPHAEVIVADDGSRDCTADTAEGAGAIVLRLPPRGRAKRCPSPNGRPRPVACSSVTPISRAT